MQPFDPDAIKARFLAKAEQIKKETGEPLHQISATISGSKDRINNIKRGLASVDLELLHNLEQHYSVDQYEIIKGVSLKEQRQQLEQVTETALAKLLMIKDSLKMQ